MTAAKAILCILDGWGCRASGLGNAIAMASTPEFDALLQQRPHAKVDASGLAVGLPEGQQGNSEVGHLTIGAGRIVLQDLTRIDAAIADSSFFTNPVLLAAMGLARERGARLHLMGLLSPGGVHSHQGHLTALLELARRQAVGRVAVHVFTDGRDTPQESGAGYIRRLEEDLAAIGVGRVVSVAGRYFAMDRDRRWDRLQRAFATLLGHSQLQVHDAAAYVEQSYRAGITDEFIPPAAVTGEGDAPVALEAGDVVIHFNFRPDRARELCHALADSHFTHFDRRGLPPHLDVITFTNFDDELAVQVAFSKPLVRNTVGEVVSQAGLTQFHVAETEKYAHVTYFINGGREEVFPGEERLLVPSSKVATYDREPQMSASAITDAAVDRLGQRRESLIVVNYANADMVGHTGDLIATIRAVEVLDGCLGRLWQAADHAGYRFVLTADHGNAELMVHERTGKPVTSHTTSQVPVVVGGSEAALRSGGGLRDIAPTVLGLMGLPVPPEMTGSDLRTGA